MNFQKLIFVLSLLLSSSFCRANPIPATAGEFTIPSKLYGNETIEVEYRIPLVNGKPGPNAHNIIFYAPFFPQKDVMKGSYIAYFSEVLGYTIFSMHFDTDKEDLDDRTKCYYYPESGSFEAVFEAQDKITKQFNLTPRKLLVMGISGGSTMAEMLGTHRADKVEAITYIGGWKYDLPKTVSPVSRCVLVTRGDVRCPANDELFKANHDLGVNILYAQLPPTTEKNMRDPLYFHMAGELAYPIMQTYLQAIVEMRDPTTGISKPQTEWPLVSRYNEPTKSQPATPELLAAIPENERLYFPSAKFADLWKKIPPLAENVSITENNISQTAFITYPAGEPKGIIYYNQIFGKDSEGEQMHNLFYLSEKGFIAISSKLRDDATDGLEDSRMVTRWILQQERFQKYPVYLAGFGLGGRLAILSACYETNPRIRKVVAVGAETEWPFPEISPKDQISKLKAPLLMIYGENDRKGGASKIENARHLIGKGGAPITLNIIPGVDYDLNKKWSDGLDMTAGFFLK